MPRKGAAGEAHVPAVPRLPQRDMRPHLRWRRQRHRRDERIVERVEHERRDADVAQVRLGGGAPPVVLGVAEAVQRRGEDVVELVEVARGEQARLVEQPRMLAQLRERLGLHRAQEQARVDLPAEPAADRMAAREQVDRRAHRGHRARLLRGREAGLLGPAQQGVAAQRDPHRQHRPALPCRHALEDPVDLLVVTRVVGARREIHLARAAAEVRHRVAPARATRDAGAKASA